MASSPEAKLNPSRDAASVLRRIGFVVLLVGLPVASFLTGRGFVLIVPIGVTLLVIAAALDSAARPLRETFARLTASSGVVAVAIGLVWAALSLAWTPDPPAALERLLVLVGTLSAAMVGYLALPNRMRAANLYLIPVGTAVAALYAILVPLLVGERLPDLDQGGGGLERGTAWLLLLLWPSIGWLRSRERDLEALTLAVLVSTAALTVGVRTPLPLALALGAAAYALSSLSPRVGATACALVMVAGILSPAILPYLGPYLGGPLSWPALTRFGSLAVQLATWSDAVLADPVRLVTGHGFGAFERARLDGSELPPVSIVQVWYDLGLVGALAAVAGLWSGPRAAVSSYAALLPGVAAAYVTAFALAVFGTGAGESWWPLALALVVLIFVAAERGQFRTRRPRARLFGGRGR